MTFNSARQFFLAAGATMAAIGALSGPASQAQSPTAADPPVSYVASVKPNNDVDPRGFSEYSPGGRLTATAVSVATLLRIAYRIQPYQLVGAPGWIGTKRYDIAAKVEDSPAPPQPVLIRALLKDRFKLAVHNETREMPIFALVAARSDGRLGPQLSKSSVDCAAYMAGPHPPPEPGRTPTCGASIGMGTLSGKAISMAQLATSLAPFAGRFSVDKTGLTGGFDVELKWAPDVGFPVPAATTATEHLSPSLFTALQEQLGLKLVSDKGPVAVLVVDRLEEPTAN